MNLYQRAPRAGMDAHDPTVGRPPRLGRQRRRIPDLPPYGGRRARDRDDIVDVIFPHGRQYAVRRADMAHFLPRVAANVPLHRDHIHIRTLLTDGLQFRFPPELDADVSLDLALEVLFNGLQRMAHGEESVDLFHNEEFSHLDHYDNPVGEMRRIVGTVYALCVVLDLDRELGCSDPLAEHIGHFMIELLAWLGTAEGRHEGEWAHLLACIVMAGYMKVFRRTIGSLGVLEQLWDELNWEAKEDVVESLRDQVEIRGEGSDAQRMLGALNHLGLLGVF